MYPTAKCYCPLGNDWYHNRFIITMIPDLYFPDYCVIQSWINENINEKDFIIEDAVDKLYAYLVKTYSPKSLEIKSHVDDAGHFPVEVIK